MAQNDWPVVQITPYDASLHSQGTKGATGVCSWGDDGIQAKWSGRWSDRTWAICSAHLEGFVESVVGKGPGPMSEHP